MKKLFRIRFFGALSDNLKSKIKNRKCAGLVVIAFLLVVVGPVADAQQTGKVFRIGILDPTTASSSAVRWEALRQELSKPGWIEGKNIAIEYQVSNGEPQRASDIAPRAVQ